ncbi:hypothetical protein CLV90_0204 [Maribacter spongiicola]|uniref:Uncharacterized protein n=2 Tax=Maribacter spongiicola TaxID=1206753 RepID=A0A4R7K5M1_9FLAO|nr:hypothetical protein CLV90_0204 [Maribacter spongiicola]
MFNWLIYGVILLAVLCACSDDNDTDFTCNVNDPVEELPWLNDWVNSLTDDYEYIKTAKYLGNDVFYYVNCNPTVAYVSFTRNCEGETIGNTAELRSEFTQDRILWLPENSICN